MTVQRDVQTVAASGERLARLPDGVLLRDLVTPLHTTELPVELGPGWRGW